MANDNQIAVKKRLIYAEDLFAPVDFKVFMGGRSGGKTMAMYEQIFRQRVEMAPTIEARPVVHARFVDGVCTNCGWFGDCVDTPHYNFCPGCGATTDLKEADHEKAEP